MVNIQDIKNYLAKFAGDLRVAEGESVPEYIRKEFSPELHGDEAQRAMIDRMMKYGFMTGGVTNIGPSAAGSYYVTSGLAAKGKEADYKAYLDVLKRNPNNPLLNAVRQRWPEDSRFTQHLMSSFTRPTAEGVGRVTGGHMTILPETGSVPSQSVSSLNRSSVPYQDYLRDLVKSGKGTLDSNGFVRVLDAVGNFIVKGRILK